MPDAPNPITSTPNFWRTNAPEDGAGIDVMLRVTDAGNICEISMSAGRLNAVAIRGVLHEDQIDSLITWLTNRRKSKRNEEPWTHTSA